MAPAIFPTGDDDDDNREDGLRVQRPTSTRTPFAEIGSTCVVFEGRENNSVTSYTT